MPDKKKALVKMLADYTEAARTWLPGAMASPLLIPQRPLCLPMTPLASRLRTRTPTTWT